MPRKLTYKQQELLDRLRQGIERTGRAPTYRTLAAEFMVTVSAINGHINALEKKGLVWRDNGVIRISEAA